MPVRALLIVYRKFGATPEQFREHWENVHVPLIKSIAGADFPISHTRTYLHRSDDAATGYQPSVVIGTADDFGYDGYAELVWRDQEHFNRFMGLVSAPDAAATIAADEAKFMEPGTLRAVMLGDVIETKAES